MKEFENLIEIADRLLGPNGCPWDQEQTFFTLQPYLLEEVHELIEAVDLKNSKKIMEKNCRKELANKKRISGNMRIL